MTGVLLPGDDGNPEEVSFTLHESSELLNIPTKSFEDYRSQLRAALRNGFDFDEFYYVSFGALRKFNKAHKISIESINMETP